ncbi:hypothetical protein QR685DRAFT_357786 [Neurospora intermedia]|uniref:BHLH domain-containing protein n=1 Tax=Neurospora intermedia TaxID=5142 RepID=A0ABR3D8C3_NEUIN
MDPDSHATKRRRVVVEHTGSYSAEYQHQSQHHYINAKTAKTDPVPPPSTSGISSGDFQFTAFPNTSTITGLSPIRFEDFLNEPTGETPRPEEPEQPGPDKKEHKAEEDVSVRERHNSIGKRYRNKLNEQFENLEALLSQQNPEEDYNENHRNTARDSSFSPTQARKRQRGRSINKASLLEMAKVRIKALTEQREMLIAEVEQLEKELAEEATKQASGSRHHE